MVEKGEGAAAPNQRQGQNQQQNQQQQQNQDPGGQQQQHLHINCVMSLGSYPCVLCFIGFLVVFSFSSISCDPPIQLLCFFAVSVNDST